MIEGDYCTNFMLGCGALEIKLGEKMLMREHPQNFATYEEAVGFAEVELEGGPDFRIKVDSGGSFRVVVITDDGDVKAIMERLNYSVSSMDRNHQ